MPEISFPLGNHLLFWCGLELRVTLRPKSLAICNRGWKATKVSETCLEKVASDFCRSLFLNLDKKAFECRMLSSDVVFFSYG